ncbi:hypothetical protein ANANG_G00048030 [Anguilla anguilla]|uniref:Uncharacterized protein n=1 Tax=Anguilla anguilla TaxID=7936 RepID=A0A9D3MWY1_ANGAN|nr:hypothetical protein ANANG_G00048030 [Anguilla anguilla]
MVFHFATQNPNNDNVAHLASQSPREILMLIKWAKRKDKESEGHLQGAILYVGEHCDGVSQSSKGQTTETWRPQFWLGPTDIHG